MFDVKYSYNLVSLANDTDPVYEKSTLPLLYSGVSTQVSQLLVPGISLVDNNFSKWRWLQDVSSSFCVLCTLFLLLLLYLCHIKSSDIRFQSSDPGSNTRDGHNSESIRCDSDKESEVRKVDVSQSENLEIFHIVKDLSPMTHFGDRPI